MKKLMPGRAGDGIVRPVMTPDVLTVLETYYDAAPRPLATAEEIGPFTLFLRRDPQGWPYYARPRLWGEQQFTAADVEEVRRAQRSAGAPETLEWVHETTPTLLDAAQAAGLDVHRCPLLVLGEPLDVPRSGDGWLVELLDSESERLGSVEGAIHAGFSGTDEVEDTSPGIRPALMHEGLLATAGAFDEQGQPLGGGSHNPRGRVSELAGIAVLPRARKRGIGAAITAALVEDARARGVETVFLSAQDDAVARVYERVGFVRVGTACIAEPPE
ncbi:MAG TPA: GNAT family N-acetyltransferase [Nocardioidaceae bacterium]|nr:GNAT family N-acetyltransferase [Nocardioidaceae bacterium]